MKKELSILSLILIIVLIVILLIAIAFFGFDQDILFLLISLILVIYFAWFIEKKKDVLKEQDVTYKDFRKIFFSIIRIVISAVIIFSTFFFTWRLWHGWFDLSIIFYIVVPIITSAFLLKASRILNSVIIAIMAGTLSGVFFFIYQYRIALTSTSEYVDWGMLYVVSIWFTLIWIISCITDALISYFIRKVLKDRVKLGFK